MKCGECGGEVKPTNNLIPGAEGQNCIVCGQLYDDEGNKKKLKLGWL